MVNSYLENLINQEVSNTVIIDFDGTIIRESKELLFNFYNEPPIEGVTEGLQKIKENGYYIISFSTKKDDGGIFEEI
jgi:histidinol phosphatase-like enzyme